MKIRVTFIANLLLAARLWKFSIGTLKTLNDSFRDSDQNNNDISKWTVKDTFILWRTDEESVILDRPKLDSLVTLLSKYRNCDGQFGYSNGTTYFQVADNTTCNHRETSDRFTQSAPVLIPKILHQTWKSKTVSSHSPDAIRCQEKLTLHSKGFLRLLWTDQELLVFVEYFFPNLLAPYKALNMGIKRADVARYLLLLQFGGVYMDLDMELKGSIQPLLDGISSHFRESFTGKQSNSATPTPTPPLPLQIPPRSFSNFSFSASLLLHPLLSTNVFVSVPAMHNRSSIFITYISKEFETHSRRHPPPPPVTATTTTSTSHHPLHRSGRPRDRPSPPSPSSPPAPPPLLLLPEQGEDAFAGNAFMAASMGSPVLSEIVGHIFNYSNPSGMSGVDVLRHTGPLGLGKVINLLKVRSSVGESRKKKKEEEEESASQVVVVLGSTIVGNTRDRPSLAEHKRKHHW